MSRPVIPRMIVEFLDLRSTAGVLCTRDAALRPRIHLLSGWAPADGGRELLCLAGGGFCDGLREVLDSGGELAATIEQIGSHETYQFKGRCAGSRPLAAGDRELWERARARYAAAIHGIDPQVPFSDRLLRDFIPAPALALRLELREIYLQTPGPGAGRRLVPPEPR